MDDQDLEQIAEKLNPPSPDGSNLEGRTWCLVLILLALWGMSYFFITGDSAPEVSDSGITLTP